MIRINENEDKHQVIIIQCFNTNRKVQNSKFDMIPNAILSCNKKDLFDENLIINSI